MKFTRMVWLVSLFSISGMANATYINFNTMEEGQYSGNSDFTVTTYGGDQDVGSDVPMILYEEYYGFTFLCNGADVSDEECSDYPTQNIIDFAFNDGQDSVTLRMYWAGEPDRDGMVHPASVSSYDIHGELLESFGFKDGKNAKYVFNSAEEIYSIRTDSGIPGGEDWWYGIRSISYGVLEPGTLGLLGLGLLGLMSARRRRLVL